MSDHTARERERMELVERAVRVLMATNHCDAPAARAILTASAERNRLAEREVAVTLLALSQVPRSANR